MFAQATGRTAAQRSGIFALSACAIFAIVFFAGIFAFAGVAYAAVPVVNDNSPSVNEDSSVQITLTGSDGDTDPLIFTILTNPSHGSLSFVSSTTNTHVVTYTPSADYNGSDEFTFKANDAIDDSNIATSSITVNAVNDTPSFTKGANQTVSENSGAQTVASWATSISKGASNESSQTLSFIVTNDNNALFSSQPAISSSGTLTYTSATNATSSAIVSVSLQDNDGGTSATQTFTITVSEDTTSPTVAVTSTTSNGSYNAGDTINVTLTFSEAVTSTESLTVTLETGSTDRTCTVSTISNSTTGTCTYTVQAGDTSSDLAVNSIVVDNSGTIADLAGNATNLTPSSNISSTSAIIIDTTAPVISSVAFSPTNGTRKIGDTITLTINADSAGYTAGTITVNGVAVTGFTDATAGTYTATYTVASSDTDRAEADEIPVSVVLTDAVGNSNSAFVMSPSAGNSPAIDANVPSAPSTPDLDAESDSGNSISDNNTSSTTPVFIGTAESGATVTIYDGSADVGTGTATGGNYSITVSTFSAGVHTITAKSTDVAGNVSATSSALSVTIDTSAPSTPVITSIATDNKINDSEKDAIVVNGTAEANSTVNVSLTSGETVTVTTTADGSGNWAVTMSGSTLTDGTVTPSVTSTDATGNTSAADTTPTAVKDVIAPTVSTITTKDADANGTVDIATIFFSESMKDSTFGTGSDFTIGGTAVTTFTTGMDDDNNVDISHGGVAGTEAKNVLYTPGTVTDLAGNALAAILAGTVSEADGAKPVLLSAVTQTTTTLTATFSENLNGATVNDSGTEFAVVGFAVSAADDNSDNVVQLTVATMPTDATPAVTFTNSGTFRDLAGNEAVTPTTVTSTDGITPTVVITDDESGTADIAGGDVAYAFTFSEPVTGFDATDVTVVGGTKGTFTAASSTVYTIAVTPTSDSTADITVDVAGNKAVDANSNGNTAATQSVQTVDTLAPTTPIINTVATDDKINAAERTATVTITGTNEAGSTVTLNSNATTVDSSTTWSYVLDATAINAFGQGSETLTAVATDTTGNTSSGTRDISVDTIAPVITLSEPESNPVSTTYGSSYSDAGATASDSPGVDITSNIGMSNPVNSATTPVGSYTVTFSVSDAAGNAATPVTRTVNVIEKHITGSFTAVNKVYDGNNSVTVLTRDPGAIISGDDTILTGGTATSSDETVANGKTVTLTGASLIGDNAGNYILDSVSTTSVNITARTLTVSASAANKVYDGGNGAIVTLSDDRVSGDELTVASTSATFSDKNASTGKTVTVAGLSISGGADMENYTLSSETATDTADITVKHVTGSFTVDNKVYDGNNSATIDGYNLTGVVEGDDVSLIGSTATFDNENAGTDKTVTLEGAVLSGTDAGNYVLDPVDTTSAEISKVGASISVVPYSVTYDGNEHTSVGTATGVLGEPLDGLDFAGTTHTNAGNYAGDTWTFVDATGNYNDTNGTVDNGITPRDITVTADNGSKEYMDGEPVSFTYQITLGSLVGTDMFSGEMVREGGEELGQYPINQGSITPGDNYNFNFVPGTFTIVDTTVPYIALLPDENPVTLEIHNDYVDAGFSASDNHDGDLTPSVDVDSSNINKDVVDSYVVTYNVTDASGNIAEEVTRTVDVVDSVAVAFDGISATLVGQDISNNLGDVNTDNVTNFPGLYFEKSSEGGPIGKLAFTGSLNLADPDTQTFLQDLGSRLDANNGRIAFDASISAVFAATGATLTMYGVTPGVTADNLIVRDESNAVLDASTIVSGFSQAENGDVTFSATHFTQFDIDTTPPTFGPSPVPSGTTGETAVARVTALDDIAVNNAQISVNGEEYVDMTYVGSLDLKKRYTYDIAVPSDSTSEITYQVKISDMAGNEEDSAMGTITVTDDDAPAVSGLADDTTLTQSKTWDWSATDNISSIFTYRYSIDQEVSGAPSGEYGDAASATQSTGDGTYYIHVQAKDEAGNESEVTTVSAVLDNTALAPESLEANSPTQTSLTLSWTNNESNGSYYTIKRSGSEITAENFDSAATLGGAPTVASGVQGYVAKNLSVGTTYYFAIKMTDALGNVSDIATASGATLASAAASSDTTDPSAVSDLRLSAGTTATSQITLNWSATGDNGTSGLATKYLIKRSNVEITDSNWDSVTSIFNSLSPKSNRSAETLTVGSLLSGTEYCFAIKVEDEALNASAISNSVCLTTSSDLPTVASVSPVTSRNDNSEANMTVTGTNFVEGTNTVRLTNADNTFDLSGSFASSTELSVTIPVGAPAGVYGVKVTNANGASTVLASAYTITPATIPLPSVTDVVPSTIGTNDSGVDVEIYGTDFTGATGAVLDTTVPTTLTNFTVVSATKITATIPGTLAAGTYNVKVTTAAGINSVSAVQVAVTAPVVINSTTSQDQVTDDPIDMGNTNTIPVQVTLQSNTDNSTLDNNTTIEVIIPPATTVTNVDGSSYTGNINPPQLVKPTAEIESVAGSNAVVITMGNPEQTINFSNDFVTTVTLETASASAPLIWYYNPSSGLEIAGKDGVKDGVTYAKGGTVMNTVLNGSTYTYTIGLLLDHMSSYVAGVNPTISGITPTSGISGSTVTVSGTNFSPGATVKFGATTVSASVVSVTQITATVPSLGTGSYTITVTNADNLSATSPTTFAITVQSGGGGISGSYGSVNTSTTPGITPAQQAVVAAPAVPAITPVKTVPTGVVLGVTTFKFTGALAVGSRGTEVTELQKRLISEGLFSGEATGYFGSLTAQAVKKFQEKYGIAQVGVVGPQTRSKLNSTPAGTSSSGREFGAAVSAFARNLGQGSKGDDVTKLQERLIKEGFLQSEATGYFGKLTAEALKKFQAKNNIEATGTVGPKTRAILNKGE